MDPRGFLLRDSSYCASRSYLDSGIQLLELASRAHESFIGQKPEQKRKLVRVPVSNSSWKAGRLTANFRQPFDLILEEATKAREAEAKQPAGASAEARFENWRSGRGFGPQPRMGMDCRPPPSLQPDGTIKIPRRATGPVPGSRETGEPPLETGPRCRSRN
jgi:hypothetical protein